MSEDRPVLIVVAGPNGSGKTSLTTKILRHKWIQGCEYVNPDDMAQNLFGGWNSPQASLRAAQEAERIREKCLAERRSLAFETVFSSPDKLDFVARAQQAGFFVRLFFVSTDSPEINAFRVARRVMSGGHDVPIPKIISRYSKSIANCSVAVRFADRAYVYDNSGDEPVLMFRSKNGQIFRDYVATRDWAAVIRGAVDGVVQVENSVPSIPGSRPAA